MATSTKSKSDATKETPTPEAPKQPVPELDARKSYTITGTGKNRHLAKGMDYPAAGADAMLLIGNGSATLKTD